MSQPMTPGRAAEAGLTLMEMLVVLVVIAVAAGATALGLGGRDGQATRAEAIRLAGRLGLAADSALTSSAPRALVWDRSGYVFLRWDPVERRWRDTTEDRHPLPAGLSLTGPGRDGAPLVIAPDLVPNGASDFVITGPGGSETIRFDGLSARTVP